MGASIADTDVDDDSDFAESHEINVTPFIDVILVLLIIFMVAAPLSTVDLPIDLPTSTATPQKKPDKPTYVSIKPDLAVAIGENLVKRVDLVRSLDAMPDASKERHIFLRADRAVPYGELMDVLEILRAGGYSKIKLVALEGAPDPTAVAGGAGKAVTGLDEQKPSRRLWIFAAVIALALHIGGAALAIAHLQTEEADDALGASAIEIGLELASVRREVTDLPPGPDTDASTASPQLAEQKAEVKETELPQDKPTEPEEADRVVTETEFEKAEGRRSEDRSRADAGVNRVGCRRSDRDAEFGCHPGRAAIGRAGDRHRGDRTTRARDLAEGTDRPSRQAQALPGGSLAKIRRDPDSFHPRPDGSRALDQHRERFRRYRVRRGGAGDGAPLRSGAGAAAVDRR